MQTQLQQLKTYLQKFPLEIASVLFVATLPLYIGEIISNSHAFLLGKYINYLHVRVTLGLILAITVTILYALKEREKKYLFLFLSIFVLAAITAVSPILDVSKGIGRSFFSLYAASLYHLFEFLIKSSALIISTATLLSSGKLHSFAFKAIAFSFGIQFIFGALQFVLGAPFAPTLFTWLGQPTIFSSKSIIGIFEYTRIYGTTPHPNILAGIVVFWNFLLLSLNISKKHSTLFGIVSACLLIGTLSKTGLLAVITLYAVYFVRNKLAALSSPKLAYWAIPLLLGLTIIATFLFPETSTTFIDSRVTIQSLYLELLQKFPHLLFTGTGFTMSIPTLLFHAKDLTQTVIWGNQILAEPPHNILFLLITELGIPLLLLLSIFYWYFWKKFTTLLKPWQLLSVILILLILGGFDHYLVY